MAIKNFNEVVKIDETNRKGITSVFDSDGVAIINVTAKTDKINSIVDVALLQHCKNVVCCQKVIFKEKSLFVGLMLYSTSFEKENTATLYHKTANNVELWRIVLVSVSEVMKLTAKVRPSNLHCNVVTNEKHDYAVAIQEVKKYLVDSVKGGKQ